MAIITPFVIIVLRRREKHSIQYVLLFAVFFLIGGLIRGAPFHVETIQFAAAVRTVSMR